MCGPFIVNRLIEQRRPSYMKMKSVGNCVCGTKGCNKSTKIIVDFELGFSAGFRKDCAERLEQQRLTTKVTDTI